MYLNQIFAIFSEFEANLEIENVAIPQETTGG